MGLWLHSEAGWGSHRVGKGDCTEVGVRRWDCTAWGDCTGWGDCTDEGEGTTLWGKACGGHGLGPLEGGESPACWAVLLGWSPSPSKWSAVGEGRGLRSPLSLGC